MSSKVVVIGSNSFSGSWFINHLLEKNCEVIGMSRSAELNPVFLPYKKQKNLSGFKFLNLDLNRDLNEIIRVISDFKPNFVVNFAAQGMVAQSWQKPEDWFMTNTLSNVKLHDQLRKFEFLEKYVHISTPEVYGSSDSGVIKENTMYNPSTPYAVSRAAADLSLMSFVRAYNFPVVFTRSANVYGPCQQLYRIIPKAILCCLINKKLKLDGGGHSIRSFIHIEDVAEGTWIAMRDGKPGDIFHLATNESISIRNLVAKIIQTLELKFEDCVEVVGERLGKDSAYLLDTEKIRSFGWRDKISLDQGLSDTILWVKENLEQLRTSPQEYIHKS